MAVIHDWIQKYTPIGCENVHARVAPETTDQEFYDGLQTAQEFMSGVCYNCPNRALWVMMQCVKDLLPASGYDDILLDARTAVLTDAVPPTTLAERLAALDAVDQGALPEQTRKYYEIVSLLIRWRLGLDDAHNTMRMLVRFQNFFELDGHEDPHGHIFGHIKTVLPFALWLTGLDREAHRDDPYAGDPEASYLPIG